MKHFSLWNISFFQIQIFLTVAERESITQAAQYLNITQPAVSKNIKYIEETLGLYLFIREKQTLRLTPSGKLLMTELTSVCSHFHQTVEKAHALQEAREEAINIGIPDSSDLKKFFLDTKIHLEKGGVRRKFHIECLPFRTLGKDLLAGTIDIVITCGFDVDSYAHPELTCITIPAGAYYAYMSSGHPLSSKGVLQMKELQPYPFLMALPMETPTYEQLVLSLCRESGFHPLIAKYLNSPNAFICNFDTGKEVFIADAFMRESDNSQLQRIPLEGTRSSIAIIRRRKNKDSVIPYIFTEIVSHWKQGIHANGDC